MMGTRAEPENVDNRRLLIHGDSLALPRSGLEYEQTWPAQVDAALDGWQTLNRSRSGNTTRTLRCNGGDHEECSLSWYRPSVVITQLGIADCAPRRVSRIEKRLIEEFDSAMLRRITYFAVTNLRRRLARRAYVAPDRFRQYLQDFVACAEANGVEQVILIYILSTTEAYRDKNKHAERAIEQYNCIISQVARSSEIVDTIRPLADETHHEKALVHECTLSDGYHLNAAGSERVADRLLTRLPEQQEGNYQTGTSHARSPGLRGRVGL